MTTFWTTTGQVPTVPVLQPTPGDALTQPYQILPGSPGVDIDNPQYKTDAAGLFPFYDGVANVIPQLPANFAAPTGAQFMQWHSAHQLQYLQENGTVAGGVRFTELATPGSTRNVLAVLSADGRSVMRVNGLQYTDLARLPLADQEALASLPQFHALIAATQGLIPTSTAQSPAQARAEMKLIVTQLRDTIAPGGASVADRNTFLANPELRGGLADQFFLEQLALYDVKLDSMGLFNPDRIRSDIAEIAERFERFNRYSTLSTETPVAGQLTRGVNALDTGATLQSGRDVFLRVESQMYEVALAKAYVAATGKFADAGTILRNGFDTASGNYLSYGAMFANAVSETVTNAAAAAPQFGRILDAPGTIFVIQNLQSVANEAEAEAKAEELNQSNRLLQDYTAMQRMINDTLKSFTPAGETASDETRALLNLGTVSLLSSAGVVSNHPDAFRSASMFDRTASAPPNTYHPIEREKAIGRPVEALASGGTLTEYRKTVWDQFSISLGEATRLLGQDSQVRMSEINSLNKAKNRSFDLGASTLNKMNEILRSIIS